jgi:antitoxin VapB
MHVEAKLFKSGNSQAVRLPKAFRMPGDVVWIERDEATGNLILKAKDDDKRKKNLAELLRLIREEPFAEDFIPPRSDEVRPNPFAEWEDATLADPAKPSNVTRRVKRVAKASA